MNEIKTFASFYLLSFSSEISVTVYHVDSETTFKTTIVRKKSDEEAGSHFTHYPRYEAFN